MKRYLGLILLTLTACSTQTPKPTIPPAYPDLFTSTYKNSGQNKTSA